jgi:hypothetical protein
MHKGSRRRHTRSDLRYAPPSDLYLSFSSTHPTTSLPLIRRADIGTQELKTRLETLSSTQHQNSARIARFAALQTQLTHRLLSLAAHLHLLVPALRSSGIRVEEEELRGWLEELREEIGVRGGGGGRMRGKLGELWALVGALGAAREGSQHAHGGEWKVVDEEGLSRIAQVIIPLLIFPPSLCADVLWSDIVGAAGRACPPHEDPERESGGYQCGAEGRRADGGGGRWRGSVGLPTVEIGILVSFSLFFFEAVIYLIAVSSGCSADICRCLRLDFLLQKFSNVGDMTAPPLDPENPDVSSSFV